MARALMIWERKILRKICGPTYENGSWTINMNQEIYSTLKSADIVTVITARGLEWLGLVMRMGGEGRVELLTGKTGGGENREDPR
jgi:hypothetical protein